MKNKLYAYLTINIKTRYQIYWMQIYLSFSSQGTFKWRHMQPRAREGKRIIDQLSFPWLSNLDPNICVPLGICMLSVITPQQRILVYFHILKNRANTFHWIFSTFFSSWGERHYEKGVWMALGQWTLCKMEKETPTLCFTVNSNY